MLIKKNTERGKKRLANDGVSEANFHGRAYLV